MASVTRAGPVYLDTNVFILAYEGAGAAAGPARRLLGAVETGAVAAVTSEITLAEVLVGALKQGDDGLAAIYRQILMDDDAFTVWPVDRTVLELSADLRVRHASLKLPDAIHLATAVRTVCTHVATADDRLPVAGELDRLALEDRAIAIYLDRWP
ncbi:type II toxin-antitoxin system VapC family toxin [Mongoliimonas terrestris]|uniref:type II toxin-antitoxin system VapC family toxin n=1 Tax=Mongoliimonas terrestris TaxID=1709001 RepID=UPI0009F9A574|nr:PIN domain-containing protein [Mongoliimonas terrestris]